MVPKRVTVCRCGQPWTGSERIGVLGTESLASGPVGLSSPTPASRLPWPALALSVVVLIGGTAFVLRSRVASTPPVAARRAAAAPATEAVTAVPVQPASKWPTDPALWKDGPTSATPAAIGAT